MTKRKYTSHHSTHRASLGRIKLRREARTGVMRYEQRGGNQSAVDAAGVSLDTYIHALFGLAVQSRAAKVLMIGCAGGTLATMLHRAGMTVSVVDIDPAAFVLAKKYFQLPKAVRCHTNDGLAFMQTTRAKFDVVIVDAFIGETIPPQFTGDDFCRAAKRCLRRRGVVMVNVCLDGRADRTADALALKLKKHSFAVRLLDEPGPQRNAVVLAGHVRALLRPKLLMTPQLRAAAIKRALAAMRFRRPQA
jgi:2-polyprenyl-3-methyl-5-hydroxy-6-metoxy-1,4-benzoquinol methylase